MFTRSGHVSGNLFSAVALLIGTAIGAGIFGLPYVISQSGYIVGIGYILGLGIIGTIVNLAFGEVVLSTEGTHQFPKYVEKYLGKRWKTTAIIVTFLGFYGALIAYTIEIGNLLYAVLSQYWGGAPLHYAMSFYVLMSIALFIGLRAVANLEKVMVIGILILILLLVIIGIPHIEITNLFTFTPSAMFLPYGVVLFAIGAASAVPDMKNVLQKNPKQLRKAIIIGSIVPIIIYLVFVTIVVGITGHATTASAVLGLGERLGSVTLLFGTIFGIMAMTTSFLSLGLVLKEIFIYDFKQSLVVSWLFVVLPPAAIVILGLVSFIQILGISGALLGGVNGIVLMRMHYHSQTKRDRVPEYTITQSKLLHAIVYLLFVLGIAYEAYIIF